MVLEPDTVEVFEDPSDVIEETKFSTSRLTVPQSQVLSDTQSISEAQLKYNLELRRLEFEQAKIQAEERKAERQARLEAEERKAERQAKMTMELEKNQIRI